MACREIMKTNTTDKTAGLVYSHEYGRELIDVQFDYGLCLEGYCIDTEQIVSK